MPPMLSLFAGFERESNNKHNNFITGLFIKDVTVGFLQESEVT